MPARIKAVCSIVHSLAHCERVTLKLVADPDVAKEDELSTQGSATFDIANLVPPITFERGQSYHIDITPID